MSFHGATAQIAVQYNTQPTQGMASEPPECHRRSFLSFDSSAFCGARGTVPSFQLAASDNAAVSCPLLYSTAVYTQNGNHQSQLGICWPFEETVSQRRDFRRQRAPNPVHPTTLRRGWAVIGYLTRAMNVTEPVYVYRLKWNGVQWIVTVQFVQ